MDTLYNYYFLLIIPIVLCLLYLFFRNSKKKKQHKIYDEDTDVEKIQLPFKKYDKYNTITESYLIYTKNNQDHYLTWKYAGPHVKDIEKKTYNLSLLPYKNKQNEFKIHLQDYHYLKKIYEANNMYNDSMKEEFDEQVFATCEFNENPDQYLELEKVDDDKYLVKMSIWSEKGPYTFVHIDDRGLLYLEKGIHDNTVKFRIE